MINFTKEQKEILKYKEGILAIPSVPGAGKTFILTHLVNKLNKDNQNGKKILLLTYMNSSVETFYARLKEINPQIEGVEIKTIHKFCLDFIKENREFLNISEDFSLLDGKSSIKITDNAYKIWFEDNKNSFLNLYSVYSKENEEDLYLSLKYSLSTSVSRLKNFGITLGYLEKLKEKGELLELVTGYYRVYETELNRFRYIDYDDILLKSYNLMIENKEIKKHYSSSFSYILEDESQDSNFLQNKILDLLNNGNLIKVGDSNQNITGSFSNSSPHIFRRFCKNSKNLIELNISHRSSENIASLANMFMKYVKFAHPVKEARKALNPPFIKSNKESSIGIKNFIAKDLNEEFSLATKKIKAFNEKYPEKTIGILVPRNKHINIIANFLKKENLNFEILSDFSQSNMQTYEKLANILSFIHNPNNKNNIIKIIELYFIKRELYIEEKNAFYANDISSIFSDNFPIFFEHLSKLKELLIFSLNTKEKTLVYIAQNFDFDEDEVKLTETIGLNLKNVFKLNPKWSYKDLINELKRVENNKFNYFNWGISKKKSKEKSIILSTYHKSKGKEWDFVYLLSLNEEFFPIFLHKEQQGEKSYLKKEYKILEASIFYEIEKMLKPDLKRDSILYYKTKKIEESMRVIYVGITRAKEFLLISSNLENDGVFYYKLFKKLISKIKKDS